MRTSVNELARFMTMFMQGGALDSTRVLATSSVEEISRPQNAAAQVNAMDAIETRILDEATRL